VTHDDVAAEHPEAVAIARSFREVFGQGVRLLYAKNKLTGAELGRLSPRAPSGYPRQSSRPDRRQPVP
jgi:hypothetical protein